MYDLSRFAFKTIRAASTVSAMSNRKVQEGSLVQEVVLYEYSYEYQVF